MNELPYWLALQHALGHTPRIIYKLLQKWGSPQTIFEVYQREPKLLPLTEVQHQQMRGVSWEAIDKELLWYHKQTHHHIVLFNQPEYPPLLKEIHTPPLLLYIVSENPTVLLNTQIAIVGTRNPTYTGRELAESFAFQLGKHNLTITSGLAVGIDACAHQGALQAQIPTIAVLGCGVDTIYPKRHTALAAQIISSGAIVSEFPIGTAPLATNFPKRNRIISGLSVGVLVIEATLRSGSLITAHFANEQGREVFAIPSSIHNLFSQGCHELIKNGAKLVENINDILTELYFVIPSTQDSTFLKSVGPPIKSLDKEERKLIDCMGFEVRGVQDLSYALGVSIQNISSRLLNLELRGYIKTVPGGYCRVKS